jgi:hypothetical protein
MSVSDETVGNLSAGEDPPEPESEGFREEQIAAEKERKLRAADKFGERSEEAKKWYAGKSSDDDAPGAALADGPRDDIEAPGPQRPVQKSADEG